MAAQTVTVKLPGSLYERLAQRAKQAQRSVEDELLDVVATAVPDTEKLPEDFAADIASLVLLNDDALWQAARSHLPIEAANRMAGLHEKRQSEGLTEPEQTILATLVRQYERYMLVRAHAAALLKERGYDVSSLLKPK